MAATKIPFPEKPSGAPEQRQLAALEFIARSLDRIDNHLELLSKSVATGGVNEGLRLELTSLGKTLERAQK